MLLFGGRGERIYLGEGVRFFESALPCARRAFFVSFLKGSDEVRCLIFSFFFFFFFLFEQKFCREFFCFKEARSTSFQILIYKR